MILIQSPKNFFFTSLFHPQPSHIRNILLRRLWIQFLSDNDNIRFVLLHPFYDFPVSDHTFTKTDRTILFVRTFYKIFHMDCFDLVSQCSQPFFPVSILIKSPGIPTRLPDQRSFSDDCLFIFSNTSTVVSRSSKRMPVDRFQCHINIKPLCLFYQSGNTVHHIRMPDLLFLQAQTRIRSFCSNNGRSQDLIEFQTFF